MKRKKQILKTGCSRIVWIFMVVLLCTLPCFAAYVIVDGTNSPYVLNSEDPDYINVAGTDPIYFPDGPGILQIMPGGYASLGVYVNVGGTIEIYGSHTWTSIDIPVQIASNANATLYTDSIDSILLDPPDAVIVGTTITVDTTGWSGKLTWDYEGTIYSLNISTLSNIAIEVVGGSGPLEVAIDIKPGSYPNAINLGSMGIVPVAILTTTEFDAATVNPDTVLLAGSGVAVRGKADKLLASLEDVDGDGDIDLLLKVETENLDPDSLQDGTAILTGQTFDGTEITGSDSITIVPPE